ncbi:polyprenyl synthetase family protein [Streptomyces sp. WMMB 322]|uniref:polyprenyl synthetase family protein n=1 Tax=Streptomyces sp. WMMB 322 TaxID=1286821 RepID=UPI000823A6D4|nr:polyprenyl synthetase family protein [Streptomyces sp. WMMB 322]SCK37781.1 geranylgeranyl diphosphate synthase, type I [Streptomyces sp. WMMB 322]
MRRSGAEALPFTGGLQGPGAGHEPAEVRPHPTGHRARKPHRGRPGEDEWALVDADVPAAVGRVLDRLLRERLDEAGAIDPTFAEDVAGRVARFTQSGGKRTRSQFLWWGLRGCGRGLTTEQSEAALRLAAGLELIQTCALVHDDVMDGSSLRRGRPAVHTDLDAQYRGSRTGSPHESFGRAAAILVGDLALAWADDVVAATHMSPGTARTVRGIWQAMRTEMVAGQYLDLQGQVTGCRSTAVAERVASLKSALYSVERPLAFGAALAGADERTTRALCSAGRCAGVAFQLRDDLFGVFGDPRLTGKPSGDDVRKGKVTYLVAVARARAAATGQDDALALLDAAVGDSGLTDGDLDRVRSALVATGARSIVEDKIQQVLEQSVRHLRSAALAPHAEKHLLELFGTVAGVPLHAAPPGREAGGPVAGGEGGPEPVGLPVDGRNR